MVYVNMFLLHVPTKPLDVYMTVPDHEEGNDFNRQTKVQTGNEHVIWIVIYCTVIKSVWEKKTKKQKTEKPESW